MKKERKEGTKKERKEGRERKKKERERKKERKKEKEFKKVLSWAVGSPSRLYFFTVSIVYMYMC